MRQSADRSRRRPAAAALAAVVVLGAGLVPAAAAPAQLTPAVDATLGPARGNDGPLGALSPALRVDLARLAIGAAGDLPLAGDLRGVAGRASVTASSPIGRRWRLAGGAAGERGARFDGLATWRGGAVAQLAYVVRAGGLWVGAEGARVASVDGALRFRGLTAPGGGTIPDTLRDRFASTLDPSAYRASALSLGAWASRGSLIGSVALRAGTQRVPGRASTLVMRFDTVSVSRLDTVRVGDSVAVLRRDRDEVRPFVSGDSGAESAVRRLAEVDTRIAWARGRVAVVGAAGLRLAEWTRARRSQGPSTASLAWGTVDAVVSVGRHAAVTLGAGTRPPAADVAALLAGVSPPAGGRARYAALGVRLSPSPFSRPALAPAVRPAPAAFVVAPAEQGGGQYTVRVRVPAARLVELSADFTRWRPVAMQRVSADLWETVLPIASGTHRVSIRVDGDVWTAPPGLTRVADDFDGSAGVLVVR